jgi:hypothetical protein
MRRLLFAVGKKISAVPAFTSPQRLNGEKIAFFRTEVICRNCSERQLPAHIVEGCVCEKISSQFSAKMSLPAQTCRSSILGHAAVGPVRAAIRCNCKIWEGRTPRLRDKAVVRKIKTAGILAF